jgi:branched-chain amino acid transport system substrate-binding protein
MKRAKSIGGNDLAAAINATKDFKAVTGNITIDSERNAVKSAVILEMKNGAPHYVTTVNP